MAQKKAVSPLLLEQGGSIILTDATSTIIRCQQGTVWLTQNNDLRDVILGPGDQFQPDRKGPVVVHALDTSCVSWAPVRLAPVSPWKTFASWFVQRLVSSVASRHPAVE